MFIELVFLYNRGASKHECSFGSQFFGLAFYVSKVKTLSEIFVIPCFFDFYFIEINISTVVEYHAKVPPFF